MEWAEYGYLQESLEKEQVIDLICSGYTNVTLSNYFTESNIKEIEDEVYKRTGIVVEISY